MYTEWLKGNIQGVMGSFVVKNGKLVESDLTLQSEPLLKNILYLAELITEKRNLKRLMFYAKKNNLFVYFHEKTALGVLLTHDVNTHLLTFIVGKILASPKELDLPQQIPSALEMKIPYFDRPKQNVMPNVPQYARQVLQFVDGKRTIEDIIYESNLPMEVVLDVILSFRRSSVLHYRDKST